MKGKGIKMKRNWKRDERNRKRKKLDIEEIK